MKRLLLSLCLASCASLPPAPPHAFVAPPEVKTPVSVCWIDTGGLSVSGGYGAAGDVTAEFGQLAYWWKNNGKVPAVLYSADVLPPAMHDDHMM